MPILAGRLACSTSSVHVLLVLFHQLSLGCPTVAV